MTKPEAYPLTWPAGLPRHSGERRGSVVLASLNRLMADVLDSLQLLTSDSGIPVYWIVVSSNVTLGDQKPQDPGIAVYFSWDGATHCIAVDEYADVEGNLLAVYGFTERCRGVLRISGLPILRAMLAGFRLPASSERAA